MKKRGVGTVYLVGAGPGDSRLITRRGEELLRRADCVIYDRLASSELLKKTRPGCEKVYVGKESDEGGHGQGRIHTLLLQKARRHSVVVRLKGGDPTLFGRLAEEMEALAKERVPFKVIPGVSSIWSAAAEAGIPLTDRRWSSSVVVATGHPAARKDRAVPWRKLARSADTLVILMGRTALPRIVLEIRGARSAKEPIALIRCASTPEQEILVSTLGQVIQDLDRSPFFGPPVVAIIGKVVSLYHKYSKNMQEGERIYLKNKKIVLTRPRQDQRGMVEILKRMGARPVSLPTVAIRPRRIQRAEAEEILARLKECDWILFNSYHAVEILERFAKRSGRRLNRLVQGKICAIGPRTRDAVESAGLRAHLIPKEFSIHGVREAFRPIPIRGKRILIPRSQLALGDGLAKSLKRRGAQVEEIALYETTLLKIPKATLQQALAHADAITFTSSSTARGFFQALKETRIPLRRALNGAAVVAIGPATARALKKGGIRRFFLPKSSWTMGGLMEALLEAVK